MAVSISWHSNSLVSFSEKQGQQMVHCRASRKHLLVLLYMPRDLWPIVAAHHALSNGDRQLSPVNHTVYLWIWTSPLWGQGKAMCYNPPWHIIQTSPALLAKMHHFWEQAFLKLYGSQIRHATDFKYLGGHWFSPYEEGTQDEYNQSHNARGIPPLRWLFTRDRGRDVTLHSYQKCRVTVFIYKEQNVYRFEIIYNYR